MHNAAERHRRSSGLRAPSVFPPTTESDPKFATRCKMLDGALEIDPFREARRVASATPQSKRVHFSKSYVETRLSMCYGLGLIERPYMHIGYARVSTSDQDAELQRVALREAGCERIFDETASGAQRDRPQLIAAIDYMREGDTLVVWKLDRLARSLKQLIDTVDGLSRRGIHVRSVTESIDTSTPNGRLIFHVFGALAEFERALIRERTLAGLALARSQGKVGGRPRAFSQGKEMAVRAMLACGELTVSEVARHAGVSVATLYRHFPAARFVSRSETPQE